LLFGLLALTYTYFYQSSQHNEAARFDQVRSVLEEHTFAIDTFVFNTADVVEYARDGRRHFYPAKAPGTTFLAAGPFWLSAQLLKPFDLPRAVYWHLVAYFTTILTTSLLSAVSAVVMYRVLARLTNDPYSALLSVIAVWLGSISFPFSTLFFSHQQVASFLVFAFAILFNLRSPTLSESPRHGVALLLAGFLLGFSIASEYPSAILVALLTFYFVFRLRHLKASARLKMQLGAAFVVGCAAGLSLLAIYNVAVFGRLFYTPYQQLGAGGGHEMFQTHAQGLVGVSWPGLRQFVDVVGEITVKPLRGLLYLGVEDGGVFACSPVLWLAIPGLVVLARRHELRAEAVLCAVAVAAYFTFNACYGNSIVFWGGGASVGPRHIIPVLPFVAVPLSFAVRRFKILFYPLLLLSIFYMLLATAVEPRTPYSPANPWKGLYLPAYQQGRFATADDGLFHRGEKLTADSTAFNLAKLAGVPGAWQLAPLMAVWFLLGAALVRGTQRVGADATMTGPSRTRASIAALGVYAASIALFPVANQAMGMTETERYPERERTLMLLASHPRQADWQLRLRVPAALRRREPGARRNGGVGGFAGRGSDRVSSTH
jgi:hypothetical protein